MGVKGLKTLIRWLLPSEDPQADFKHGTKFGIDAGGVIHILLVRHSAEISHTEDWTGFKRDLARTVDRIRSWTDDLHNQL